MSTEIKVPVLPESVADATVAAWHKKPGDSIRRDENLVDLETDKVVLEVPSPVDGVIGKILRETGETVTSDEVLGIIEEGAVAEAEEPVAAAAEPAETKEKPAAAKASVPESAKLSPSARRVAEEEKADVSKVSGTGRGGRITKGDMLNYLSNAESTPTRPVERVRMTRLRATIADRMKQAQNTAAILTSFNEVDLKAVMDLRAK